MKFPLKEKESPSSAEIIAAKCVSAIEVLAQLGFQPVTQTGGEWVYRSPKTDERTPSFFVNPAKNVFIDYSGGEKGDVVRLVQYLTGRTFAESVTWLLSLSPISLSFSGPALSKIDEGSGAPVIKQVRPLTHPALTRYVRERAVSVAVAAQYCREVHFLNQSNGRHYFAVGFANDGGGYALRNGAGYKGQIAPAGFTTLPMAGSKVANLFEGFFDFLSAVQLFGSPRNVTIVLNSTAHVTKVLPVLRNFDSLNLYLDRDKAGYDVVARLRKEGLNVIDRSGHYEQFNDLNQFLVNQ